MTVIDFSVIPDADADYQTTLQLVEEFRRETGIEVNIKRMEWGNAWPQLIGIATQGHGADISHVGSTWVSSLMVMDALRPIPSNVIGKIGGEQAFAHSTWTSVVAGEDRNIYGIPWSAYMYIVAYRKDLLQQAGLNGNTAFATPHAFEESIKKLEELKVLENIFLMPVVPPPFNDFIHMAASFIWSSGGHIMDNRGKQVVFNSPASIAGLKSYIRLLRKVPSTDRLEASQCMAGLLDGKAAVVITDARALYAAIRNKAPNVERIGAASLMSIPWSGGGSFVVWRHTHGYPDRLEASFNLLEFLARKKSMLTFADEAFTLPSRTDALDELIPPDHALRPVMLQFISTGRSYRPIPLWHRIEYQFGMELGQVIAKLINDPSADIDSTVTQAMDAIANRLNLTLG